MHSYDPYASIHTDIFPLANPMKAYIISAHNCYTPSSCKPNFNSTQKAILIGLYPSIFSFSFALPRKKLKEYRSVIRHIATSVFLMVSLRIDWRHYPKINTKSQKPSGERPICAC